MDAKTDAGDRCTGRYVASAMSDALAKLRGIASTGVEALDADLLSAEQALRRIKSAALADPE